MFIMQKTAPGKGRRKLTRFVPCVRMDKPQKGRALLLKERSATSLRREVMRMWRKRLYWVLRFLVCLAATLYILTTKAC